MDPNDHRMTTSHGNNGLDGIQYRAEIEQLIKAKKWRDAMVKELRDIRRIARCVNDSKKYNEAMREMLEYFKCLHKNDLLP